MPVLAAAGGALLGIVRPPTALTASRPATAIAPEWMFRNSYAKPPTGLVGRDYGEIDGFDGEFRPKAVTFAEPSPVPFTAVLGRRPG